MIPLFLLLAAAVECIHLAPGKIETSTAADACAADLTGYEKLVQPGVVFRPDVATATRAPWLISNGARLLRANGRHVYYRAAHGRADLCAAEAFAYGASALIESDAPDRARLGPMLRFLQRAASQPLLPRVNIGFVDDGSPEALEAMSLLIRRNLLFRIVTAPDPRLDLNIQLGSPDFPPASAANPSEFAALARRKLGDQKRLLRIYGSEVVVGRLTGDRAHARLHLLNYSERKIEGLRARVLGGYRTVQLSAPGSTPALTDVVAADGAIEFSLPALEVYAILNLR